MLSGMHLAVMSYYETETSILCHVLRQAIAVQHLQLHISKSIIVEHI